MSDSILNTTKKMLGLAEDLTVFDLDIITHINSVFVTLQQLGVGPKTGFWVESDGTDWSEYTEDRALLNNIKSYMFLRVRLLFDPPQTSYLVASLDEQRKELEWRIEVMTSTEASLSEDTL